MNNEATQPNRKPIAKSRFANISTILPGVVTKLGLDRRMQEQALFSLWSSLVDPIYASRSMPLYLDGQGIMVVAVENGSTAQELSFAKTKLLKQLQPIAGSLGMAIKGMRFDLKRFYQVCDDEKSVPGAQTISHKKETVKETIPADSDLWALTLTAAELEEIAILKETLSVALAQLNIEPERIACMVEKRMRFEKWRVQHNM